MSKFELAKILYALELAFGKTEAKELLIKLIDNLIKIVI